MDTLGPGILSFIERLSNLRRLKCTSIIDMKPQSVSFYRGVYLLCALFGVSFIRGSTAYRAGAGMSYQESISQGTWRDRTFLQQW